MAERGWPTASGIVADTLRTPGFSVPDLGPVDQWPAALRYTLDAILPSAHRMLILWGPRRRVFYNEALIAQHPAHHPTALGAPFGEAWPEAWETFQPMVDRAWTGETVFRQAAQFVVDAQGREMVVDLSVSPLRDADGAIAGVLYISIDQTERVAAEAREHHALAIVAEKSRALEIVNRAGTEITGELDIGQVTQVAVDAGVALSGAQFGAFFYNVHDDARGSYMLYSLSGVPRSEFENFPMPRNTAVFAPTFNGEGVTRSDDITRDPRYGKSAPHHGMPKGHLPVRSYLSVPVRSRTGEVIGGLFFGHAEAGVFTAVSEDSLVSLAGQAAVAIDNARLFQAAAQEIDRRAAVEEQLRILNDTLEARVAAEIEERRQAEMLLQQAQKMETIGKLTGGVAHDFNNLLQVISGNLQLLTHDISGNERAERRVSNALAGVNRGAKLASQLLAFGRRQPLEPKVVNIGRFLAGIDDMLHRALGEAIEVEAIVSGGLWNCFVDTAQMENAVLNLAINARDAMDGTGKLTIEAGNAYLDDAYARTHSEVNAGQYIMLAVTDTGSGIPADVIEQVFEPFFSTKAEGKGTGLGLSMVYGFVKQSGGHVKIYSEVGQGTTVKIYLPRVRQRETAATDLGPVSVVGGTETILVAEDDEGVRTTVVDLLTELGYHVLKAVDAQSALTVIESGVAIDLLFTDVVMPGELKSPQLARIARERLPALAVLFTSGYTENSIVHGGKLDAGVELLSKPYSREALARKVRQVLANRKPAARKAAATRPRTATPRNRGPKLTVLLVEDEDQVRANTADLLKSLGHLVVEAASAEEAVAALHTAPIDVLVTDLGLPGISGDEFADRARTVRPGIGIVYATGSPLGAEISAETGAYLLRKPYDSAGLSAALKTVGARTKTEDA